METITISVIDLTPTVTVNLTSLNASDYMTVAIYDPTSVQGDAFDMDNMVEGTTTKILTDTERALIINDGTVDRYINSLRLNLTPTVTPEEGQMYWDVDSETVSIALSGGSVLQVGQEMYTKGVNKTGVQINDGEVVYVFGVQGNRPKIILAQADSYSTATLIGVATQNIANNLEGFITTSGVVNGYNTSGFTAGDKLYLSNATPGLITNIVPTSPDFLVFIGYALNSTESGSIFISPDLPLSLDNTFTDNSDLFSVSQKAIKTYVDANAGEVNPDLISQAEAEAGTAETERTFSALRVAQAIAALESFVDNSVTIAKASAHYKTRVTANVVTSYAIDRDAGSTFELTMTGATTFTDSNLASGTNTEVISIILDGNFVPTFPVYWEATPSSDAYSGAVRNLLVVETVNGTGASEDVIYSLENLTT